MRTNGSTEVEDEEEGEGEEEGGRGGPGDGGGDLEGEVHPPVNRSVKFSMMFTTNTQVLNPQHILYIFFSMKQLDINRGENIDQVPTCTIHN